MSARRLQDLLRNQARDGKITLDEVAQLITASESDAALTANERLTLEAALEAHKATFEADAYRTLVSYLKNRK